MFSRFGKLSVVGAMICWALAVCADTPSVVATYDVGHVETAEFKIGADPYLNRAGFSVSYLPSEVKGFQFTRIWVSLPSSVTIQAPAGSTVYIAVSSLYAQKPNPAINYLVGKGWRHGPMMRVSNSGGDWTYEMLRMNFRADTELRLDPVQGVPEYMIAAQNLSASVAAPSNQTTRTNGDPGTTGNSARSGAASAASPTTAPDIHPDGPLVSQKAIGPSTKPAQMQAAIHTLAVQRQSSGLLLGVAWNTVLTLSRGEAATEVNFRFVTPVGPRMRSSKEDALRYVHLRYPNWDVSGAELTFEDRETPRDGGSIGAALTTLMLSAIEGFKIDRHVAVTGDISADGAVMKIGGVYAKVHGAEDANCRLVVLPADNFDQLLNTETFVGKGEVPKIQVIGVETVDDMIAVVRQDRDAKLAKAIDLYDEVQQEIATSKAYLKKPECAEKLTQILHLCPEHFSAKLLMMEATNKRPKTLSEGASLYYVSVAVNEIMPTLAEHYRDHSQQAQSTAVHQGLEELDKLRPMCDSKVIPLMDAWQRYIRTLSSYEAGLASPINLESQRQTIRDAMTKLKMDPESMQKLMKEGV